MNQFTQNFVNSYENNVIINNNIKNNLIFQQNILEDIDNSLPQSNLLIKKINEIDLNLLNINKNIENLQKKLYSLLELNNNNNSFSQSNFFKNILKYYQFELLNICQDSINKGWNSVLVSQILELEDFLFNNIEELIEKGLFIENSIERMDRLQKVLKHKEKVVPLIGNYLK